MARAPVDIRARETPHAHKGRGKLGPGSPPPSGVAAMRVAGQVVFPPSIYPPQEGKNFFEQGSQAGVTLATGLITLASFQVPSNSIAFVREISLVVNNMLTTTNIRFTLRQNGGGIAGYTNMVLTPRSALSVSATLPAENTVIFINDGALIELVAQVIDGGTYQIGGTFRGWHIPKRTADLYPRL